MKHQAFGIEAKRLSYSLSADFSNDAAWLNLTLRLGCERRSDAALSQDARYVWAKVFLIA